MHEAVRGEPSLQPQGPDGSNIRQGHRGMREGAGKTSGVWGLRFPEPQTGGRLGWESGEPRAGCADREAFKGQMGWVCLCIPWAKSSPQAARLVFSAPTSAKSRCPPAAQHPPAPNPCLCTSSSLSPSPQADSAPPPLQASRPLPATPALSPPWAFVSPQISLSVKAESGEPDPILPRIHGALLFPMPLLGWDGDYQPGKWYKAWRGSPRGAASGSPGSHRGLLAAAWGSLWPRCVSHASFLWVRATAEVLVGRIPQKTAQYRVPGSPFPPCVHSTLLGFLRPFIYLMPQCDRLSPPLTDASTGRA